MLTLTCFLLTHWPPTWKRRFFAFRARMVRPWSPNWCVAACFAFVPTANPEASAVTWIELRSCEESMRVFPPVVAARMEVFHLLPSGARPSLKRSRVDSRTPSPRAMLRLLRSISEYRRIFRRSAAVSPSRRILYTNYIPLIFARVNRRGFDFAENPVAAALAGSSVSVPIETFPSATRVRNLIAALYRLR